MPFWRRSVRISGPDLRYPGHQDIMVDKYALILRQREVIRDGYRDGSHWELSQPRLINPTIFLANTPFALHCFPFWFWCANWLMTLSWGSFRSKVSMPVSDQSENVVVCFLKKGFSCDHQVNSQASAQQASVEWCVVVVAVHILNLYGLCSSGCRT